MSEVFKINCKNCGAPAQFDARNQVISCKHCGQSFDLSEYNESEIIQKNGEKIESSADNGNLIESISENANLPKSIVENADSAKNAKKLQVINKENKPEVKVEDFEHDLKLFKQGNHTWGNTEKEGMSVYSCNSCGAEVLVSNISGTAKCPYCENNLVFTEKFTNDLRPDSIIAFKKTKEDAINGYYEFLHSKKRFLPRIFKNNNHIDEIQGIYVPYWVFDATFKADYFYKCETEETWQTLLHEYTKTTYYDVYREGTISFNDVPHDASKRMDDELLYSIEPFDLSEATDFSTYYLGGFMAERFDVSAEECVKEVVGRMENTIETQVEKTITGYQSTDKEDGKITLKEGEIKYTMYPVWYLNTTFKNKKYTFAMNGQTGKVVGTNLPKDPFKVALFALLYTVLAFIVLSLLLMCLVSFYSFIFAFLLAPIAGVVIALIDSYFAMRSIKDEKEADSYIKEKLELSRKEDKYVSEYTSRRLLTDD